MLFFLVATINAIVISLLISLAAAGGFLAIFFACVTAIYIGALSVAAVVVSTATISAIIAALVVTGIIFLFFVQIVLCIFILIHETCLCILSFSMDLKMWSAFSSLDVSDFFQVVKFSRSQHLIGALDYKIPKTNFSLRPKKMS